jgi:hypothetical protein
LAEHLPHRTPASNNHLTAVDKALAFTHGLLCEARKLTHVAYFRRDPMVPELLDIRRVASQSSFSRFFTVLHGLHVGGKQPAVLPAAVAVVCRAPALAPRRLTEHSCGWLLSDYSSTEVVRP